MISGARANANQYRRLIFRIGRAIPAEVDTVMRDLYDLALVAALSQQVIEVGIMKELNDVGIELLELGLEVAYTLYSEVAALSKGSLQEPLGYWFYESDQRYYMVWQGVNQILDLCLSPSHHTKREVVENLYRFATDGRGDLGQDYVFF